MELSKIVVFVMLLVIASATFRIPSGNKRIANGNDAYPGDFPYIASYQYSDRHYCGCTIISISWVLTAAHCIETVISIPGFNIQLLTVVAGITNLYTTPPPSTKQVKYVFKQYMHYNYNRVTFANDIGLVKINGAFAFGNRVISIPIGACPDNSTVAIVGWGYLQTSYPVSSPNLQYALGTPITNTKCQSIVSPLNGTVAPTMTCMVGYAKGNETTCGGDSGGPLLQDSVNGTRQIGVCSWDVKPCGLFGMPSVSTLIYPFRDWLNCIGYYENVTLCRVY